MASSSAAFEAQLRQAQQQMQKLEKLKHELKADDHELQSYLHGLRTSLEEESRYLSAAQARRAKLEQELRSCEKECANHEAAKQQLMQDINDALAKAAKEREHKLRLAGYGKEDVADVTAESAAAAAAAAAVPSAAIASSGQAGADLLGQAEDLLGLDAEFEGFDIGNDPGSDRGAQSTHSTVGGVDLMGDAISSGGACMVPFGQSQQNSETQHHQPGEYQQPSHSSGEDPLAGFAQPMRPQGSMNPGAFAKAAPKKPADPFADLLG